MKLMFAVLYMSLNDGPCTCYKMGFFTFIVREALAWHEKNNVCKQKIVNFRHFPATDMHLVQRFSKGQIPVYLNSSSCCSSRPFAVHLTCASSENLCVFIISILSVLETESLGANLESMFALCHYKYLVMSIPLNTNTALQLALHVFHVGVICLPWKCKTSTQNKWQKTRAKVAQI